MFVKPKDLELMDFEITRHLIGFIKSNKKFIIFCQFVNRQEINIEFWDNQHIK